MIKNFNYEDTEVTVFDGDHLSIQNIIDEIANYEYKQMVRQAEEERLQQVMQAVAEVIARKKVKKTFNQNS